MVIWGAVWGAVLGLLWPGHGWDYRFVIGLALGALAGSMLRNAVRAELKAAGAAVAATPVAQVPTAVAPVQAPVLRVPAATAASAAVATPSTVATSSATAAAPATAPPPPPAPSVAAAPRQPDPVTRAFHAARDWLFGGNTVVRMGVLVLFVGLAFLAKYSIEHALLPPELRLAGIAAAGIALFVAGFRLRRKSADKLAYALTLQGAGIAALYLTVFAAFRLYQFIPPGAAFATMGLVSLFAAVIAVAQNAQAMAFIGFAGGFAAPLLVASGQGNHVGLFMHYLLLGIAIAVLAWAKAWRSLNLLGFFATFGVATAWGVLKYQPSQFDTTEPFLLAFFAVYLVASLLYATRHSLAPKQAVDATLIFGTPLVAFVLQVALVREIEYAAAFSSLALGALYLGLGWWMARRQDSQVHRWLAECFAALGLGFATLAVPLALDSRWTSVVWAIEGAAVFWMGRRQQRWLARAAGLALQLFAALAFLDAHPRASSVLLPFANPGFIGGVLLAAAAAAIAHWSREPGGPRETPLQRGFSDLEHSLSPALFWLAFLWWQYALGTEILRPASGLDDTASLFDRGARLHLQMLAWVVSAFAVHHLALPGRARPWPVAATPACTVLPAMLVVALLGAATLDHVFVSGGWAAWPLALALHAVMLRRLDAGPPRRWWPLVHAAGVWLMVLLVGNVLVFAVGKAALWQTAWATVILLVAATVVLLVLAQRRWFAVAENGKRWPLDRFGRDYLWVAAAPLAAGVALGALLVALSSNGDARPLPYVPLLNPTDLAVAIALAACAIWLARVRSTQLAVPPAVRHPRWMLGLAGLGFVALNTVWLRVAHNYGGVPWDAHALSASFLVQAGYSILWTLTALALMIGAHRRASRAAWMTGAGLLGLTVLKLFVVDLSNRGGSERIVVFIAVGLLMLVVGYFAPAPPSQDPASDGDNLKAVQP